MSRPIWFVVDTAAIGDGRTASATSSSTPAPTRSRARHLRRDPRVSLCVDDERPPFSFVIIEGVATISEELGEVAHWAAVIGGRYMGAERAEEYGRRNGVPGELLVRVATDPRRGRGRHGQLTARRAAPGGHRGHRSGQARSVR